MYYKEVANKAYKFILNRLEQQRNMPQEGGILRDFSKETVELLMDLIYNEFNKYYNTTSFTFIEGKKSPVILGDNVIEESVDRHMYKNNKLICGIECKTYLDKCYMQRADSDFNLMKTELNFNGWIVSLENGISDNAYKFFMSRNNINTVYYLASGKRNSTMNKRIYYHPERIKLELVEILCKDFEQLIFFNVGENK